MNILLTGATGFVGNHLLSALLDAGHVVVSAIRGQNSGLDDRAQQALIQGLTGDQDWYSALVGCELVIHAAARAHIMSDSSVDPLAEYRRVNVDGTLALARQAAKAGVRRFIYLSSIKVNGESTAEGTPFCPETFSLPDDPYGVSKYEAEAGLRKLAEETSMEVVIIRPPLVYGPGVKANFAAMMKWVAKGMPLPLAGILQNRRSLVSLDNLADFILTCAEHPQAGNQTFLVSDGCDISTSGLLALMAEALSVPNRMLPIPVSWLRLAAKLVGKPAIAQRLCGSLQVDISKNKELLGWVPPFSSAECMKKTALAFLENNSNK